MSEQQAASTSAVDPALDPTVDATPQRRRQPPYAVIIENDDEHTFEYVIIVLRKVCGHSTEKAYQLAMETHIKGRAVVWHGTLEVAELKRDLIRGFGPDRTGPKTVTFPLGVTIEPMEG